jgi:hypothetical protein
MSEPLEYTGGVSEQDAEGISEPKKDEMIEGRKICILRIFVICTLYRILLGSYN